MAAFRSAFLFSICSSCFKRFYCARTLLAHNVKYVHTGNTRSIESKGTVVDEEIKKYSSAADQFWGGGHAGLEAMNRLRVPFIRDVLLQNNKDEMVKLPKPLSGFRVLDVGCGGGLLSEPLARLGASVFGIDPCQENIEVAVQHARRDPALAESPLYHCDSIENLARTDIEPFDGILASEVLEHVNNISLFLSSCSTLLKPGGSMIITTINRTFASYALAIVAAEYLTRLVPPGTHQWSRFVRLEELQLHLKNNNLTLQDLRGLTYNPLTNRWCWINDTSVNYAVHAIKM